MSRLKISACLSRNPMTAPLANLSPEGIDWHLSYVHPSEMFWRQLKFADFDVSEMSLATLLIGWAQGKRDWVALPIFTTRRFFHTSIVVRRGAGIESPADLRGKRVGVPEYQQTSALWSRSVLQHDFGVHPSEMKWFMERPAELSHGGSTGFTPPPGVDFSYVQPGETLAGMMARGELDASFVHLTENNLIDRSTGAADRKADVLPLFPDPRAEGQRYLAAHGLFPINHCVVVRRELVEQHPWVVLNLYAAFEQAKRSTLTGAAELFGLYETAGIVGAADVDRATIADPVPYGFQGQEAALRGASRYLVEQGLMESEVDVREIFAEQTLQF
jgi:4,5-dihydroxyphthalate decarboxylase